MPAATAAPAAAPAAEPAEEVRRLFVLTNPSDGRETPASGKTKRKDNLQREARIFRRRFQTKGHQGGQGHGSEPDFD